MMRFVAFLFIAGYLHAHVGSPDVFFEGKAGPYPLSIAIRPPTVIPGIAEVEIRTASTNLQSLKVVPFPLVGVGSKYPPTPDLAKRSPTDAQFYTASVWLMAFGSYQVRIDVDGPDGHGSLSVPIPSVARETKQMQPGLGFALSLMMVLIVVGAVSIATAAARESTLPPSVLPNPADVRKSRIMMGAATLALLGILYLGNRWWGMEASSYRGNIYKQPLMQASLKNGVFNLQLPPTRKPDDYLPDHGHLMHLFVVHVPEMDRMWHLHPELIGNSEFEGPAPALAAGHYKLFADIVHGSGFPETPVADLDVAQPTAGKQLSADDAEGSAPPLSQFDSQKSTFTLPDGYRMVRTSASGSIAAKQMQHLSFEVQDPSGRPATDLEPYMGMAAHAEFINADSSVFAHVHPSGTVPMASLGLTAATANAHESHGMMMHNSAQLGFPYGFPKPGRYRMFIQIQRAAHPETAAFDFDVQ